MSVKYFLSSVPWSDYFSCVGKRLNKKIKVNFKIYDVINWETNKYNTDTVQYVNK